MERTDKPSLLGMGYGLWQLASHRLVLAAVSTERFAIFLPMTDECEF
jgi:hypothetical protein